MNIYNHPILPFIQLSSLDFQQVLSENAQKYAKIAAVVLAIFAAAASIYFLIKCYEAKKPDDQAPKDDQNIPSSPIPKPPTHHKKRDLAKPNLNPVKQKDTQPDPPPLDQLPPEEAAVKIEENDGWIIAFQVAEEAEALERAQELEKTARERVIKNARNARIDNPLPIADKPRPAAVKPQPIAEKTPPVADTSQEDEDYALALSLQLEEEEQLKRAQELAHARREQLLKQANAKKQQPVPAPIHPQAVPAAANPPLKQDLLHEHTARLAGYIDEILTQQLAEKTKRNLRKLSSYLKTHNHKNDFRGHTDPLYQSFIGSYQTLCEFFKDKEFPLDKKMEVLERLESERHQCLPGQAGLLNDICNSMDEPVDIDQKLPWLIGRYKTEILRSIFDDVYSLNNVIKKHGIELGLPAALIKGADAIPNYGSGAAINMQKYYSSCTPDGCLDFLGNYINSDLPGKGAYRQHILRCLADQVTDEQVEDENEQAFIKTAHEAALENRTKPKKKSILKNLKTIPILPKQKLNGKRS